MLNPERKSNFALVAIGILKLVKSGLLLTLGIALVRWRNDDLGQVASHWIDTLWLSRPYFEGLVAKLSLMSEQAIEECAAGPFVYSILLLIEGIGLCRRRRWAEFLTVFITGSLLPFEFYELAIRLTLIRVAITLLNVPILWDLIAQLMKGRLKHVQADGS